MELPSIKIVGKIDLPNTKVNKAKKPDQKKKNPNYYRGRRAVIAKMAKAQGWLCHYCGCKCVMATEAIHRPIDATIEHLFSRLDIRRHLTGKRKWTVMSCYACNHRRSEEDRRAIEVYFEQWQPYIIGILRNGYLSSP